MPDFNTKLVTKAVPSLHDAAAHLQGDFNVSQNYKTSPMILVPERNSCQFWLTIPEGFHALVTSHGRFVGLWAPGCHMARPWERVSHLVTKQYVVYDTPVKECPTMDNVMVVIDVSIVFVIKNQEKAVSDFVYRLGPERLETMLAAYQEEAVRSMARQKKYTSIYDLMDTEELQLPKGGEAGEEKQASKKGGEEVNEQLENTKRIMNERLKDYGVEIYSITITNVHLPNEFRKQMEDATTFDSKNILQQAEQAFNMQVIQDNEKRNKAAQRLEELKQEHNSENAKQQAVEVKLTGAFRAETEKAIAEITENMQAEVLKIRTQNELEVITLEKDKELSLQTIAAEAEAEARQIKSQMESWVMSREAEAKAQVAANEAETLAVMAKAEKIASPQLKSKRDFEKKMAHLRILKNMALNSKLTLSGSNRDNLVAQMVASQHAGAVLGLNVQ